MNIDLEKMLVLVLPVRVTSFLYLNKGSHYELEEIIEGFRLKTVSSGVANLGRMVNQRCQKVAVYLHVILTSKKLKS